MHTVCSGGFLDTWLFSNVRFRECGMRLPLHYGRPINITLSQKPDEHIYDERKFYLQCFFYSLTQISLMLSKMKTSSFLLIFLSLLIYHPKFIMSKSRRLKIEGSREKHITLKRSSEKWGLGVGRDSLQISLQMDKAKSPKHLYPSSDEFFLDVPTWNQKCRSQLHSMTTHPFNVIAAASKMPFGALINSESIY